MHLSAETASWVRKQGWRGANCLMGFVRNVDPDLCAAAKAAGLVTVADQMIAPAAAEAAAMLQQAERWPEWVSRKGPSRPEAWVDFECRTWAAADQITCPSPYVRGELLRQGVPPEKVSELPYPIEVDAWESVDRSARTGPVTVGYVGAVGLRKGAPAVLELARRFNPSRVRFVMVGPIQAPPGVLADAERRVVLTGSVPRSEIRKCMHEFDVFLLPSACEGSAGSVMEAMASALPVVTTPSSGTLARDGVEGFIRDCHDIDGMASCLQRLAEDPDLRSRMGRSARRRAEEFGLDHYGRRLDALLRGLLAGQHQRPGGRARP